MLVMNHKSNVNLLKPTTQIWNWGPLCCHVLAVPARWTHRGKLPPEVWVCHVCVPK